MLAYDKNIVDFLKTYFLCLDVCCSARSHALCICIHGIRKCSHFSLLMH